MTQEADVFEGRWKGTTDLDAEALQAVNLDGLVVAVVAFRVEECGATKVLSDGKKRRKDVFDVMDVRMLTGEAREFGVRYLEGRGEFELPEVTPIVHSPKIEEGIRNLRAVARRGVFGDEDPEVREFDREQEAAALVEVEDEDIEPPVQEDEEDDSLTRVSMFDYKKAAKPGARRDGVGKFDPSAFDGDTTPDVGETTRIGSVRNPNYQGKDPILKKFLES